ncbi:hypothetical protein BLA29_012604 [Euroglyphus maynei]|uniref:Uncharacterized protein n=1 Tax=Euroglyphus maynei TaxID=6958 RepID=A0A1Y3AMZ5_EURMA|nr:hypothetical protein BLA29_012604 [Euroglyphus maynei]
MFGLRIDGHGRLLGLIAYCGRYDDQQERYLYEFPQHDGILHMLGSENRVGVVPVDFVNIE